MREHKGLLPATSLPSDYSIVIIGGKDLKKWTRQLEYSTGLLVNLDIFSS